MRGLGEPPHPEKGLVPEAKGVSPPLPCEPTHTCENIFSSRTMYAGGNKSLLKFQKILLPLKASGYCFPNLPLIVLKNKIKDQGNYLC